MTIPSPNDELQQPRSSRSACNPGLLRAGSLSLGRWAVPPPMNTTIELHDSIVAEITEPDGEVVVHFAPAYLHKSEGRPGVDAGTGWVQEARLIFAKASIGGSVPDLPCAVMDGELIVGAEQHDNQVTVPLAMVAHTELRLVFDSIHTVTVSGRSVRLELLGEPRYVEEFKP